MVAARANGNHAGGQYVVVRRDSKLGDAVLARLHNVPRPPPACHQDDRDAPKIFLRSARVRAVARFETHAERVELGLEAQCEVDRPGAVVVDADGGTAGLVVRRREPRRARRFRASDVGCVCSDKRSLVGDRKDSNALIISRGHGDAFPRGRCRCVDGGHGRLEIDPRVLGRAVAELVEAREHGAAPELGSEADTNEHVVVEPQKVWTSFDPRACHEGADVAGAQPVGAQPTRDVQAAPGIHCVVARCRARVSRGRPGLAEDRGSVRRLGIAPSVHAAATERRAEQDDKDATVTGF